MEILHRLHGEFGQCNRARLYIYIYMNIYIYIQDRSYKWGDPQRDNKIIDSFICYFCRFRSYRVLVIGAWVTKIPLSPEPLMPQQQGLQL